VGALMLLAGVMATSVPMGLGALPIAYLVLWLGAALPLQGMARRHDISYGMYIYAFPVQQLLAMLGSRRLPTPVDIALVLAITSVLAVVSAIAIEQPALRLKHWTPRLGRRFASDDPPLVTEP